MTTATTTTITGNLTRDPEIRYTRDGQATTTLGVAVNRRWQNRETNEWEESTSFFDVVTWRDLAENVALSLTRGMRVVVTGRLEQRSWETEEGDRRFKVEIVADEVGASLRFATVDVHKVLRPHAEDADQWAPAPMRPETPSAPRPDRWDRPARPPTGGTPERAALFSDRVHLTKREAFDACQALADADRVLVAADGEAEARALGDLFELLEDRLTTPRPPRSRADADSPGGPRPSAEHDLGRGQESVGSYSMEREFTQ